MKTVLLLLCTGVEIYEAAAFYDVLGWSGEYGTEKIEVVTVGLQDEVRCTFGLKVLPDYILEDIMVDDFDGLAIPGGFGTYGFYEQAYTEAVVDLIHQFDSQTKPIATICVGALPVGYSGVLTGRQATTYHLRDGERRKQLASFGVKVIDQPLVCDQNIVSSNSPATAMEVAFWLLAYLTDEENANLIRHLMGYT